MEEDHHKSNLKNERWTINEKEDSMEINLYQEVLGIYLRRQRGEGNAQEIVEQT